MLRGIFKSGQDPTRQVAFYQLGVRDLWMAFSAGLRGFMVTYDSASYGVRALLKFPGVRNLPRSLLTEKLFEKTISEYEGSFYRIQHETIELTQDYYRKSGLGTVRAVQLYKRHYGTEKIDSVLKYLLQKKVKLFLTWLYLNRHAEHPPQVIVVPDGSLWRFIIENAQFLKGTKWQVRFHGSTGQSIWVSLAALTQCWAVLIKSLLSRGLCCRVEPVTSYRVGFRAHWPRKEGLLRTDFLMNGKHINRSNMAFYLEDASSDYGKRMCEFLTKEQYPFIVLDELRYPIRCLPRLVRDYAILPLRAMRSSLPKKGEEESAFVFLALASRLLIKSKLDLLLEHYRFDVLFSFHSAGFEMVVAAVICQKYQCQFMTYSFGITVFQGRWSDYAFQNANVFFSWGPDMISVFAGSHGYDRVVHTGFWGFQEYNRAAVERESLRSLLKVDPQTRLVIFYDSPYFPERSPFTAELLYNFYRAALACSEIANTSIILKMKNNRNEDTSIYPVVWREKFRKLWDNIKSKPNIRLAVTLDWDPLQMIAVSDVNVTLEVSTPSTLALLCGKAGFFLNTVEQYVYHPLLPKYKGRLIFSDAESLVRAIQGYLEQGLNGNLLPEDGDLDGYNAGGKKDGLQRFRQEVLKWIQPGSSELIREVA